MTGVQTCALPILTEDKYEEKIKGDEKEVKILWTALKKVTDYFRIKLEVKWTARGMTDVEAEIDGKKKQMNKFSELKIDIKGTLEKDYESKWTGSPIQKFMKDVYNKFVIPATTTQREEEIREAVIGFKDEMKAFFDLICKRVS